MQYSLGGSLHKNNTVAYSWDYHASVSELDIHCLNASSSPPQKKVFLCGIVEVVNKKYYQVSYDHRSY